MKVNMLIAFVQMGIGVGIQPLIGYSYGAKNMRRLKKAMRFTMMCTVIIGTVLSALYIVFAPQIINVFNGEHNAEVTDYGVKILRALMISGPFLGIMFTYNFAFQGMGRSLPSLVISLGRQGLVFLPLLVIMSKYIGFDGIVFAQPVADLACVILAAAMFAIINAKIKKDPEYYPQS